MSIRLQDLPDISEFLSDSDQVLIVKTNSQGLTNLGNLKPYETIGPEDLENND